MKEIGKGTKSRAGKFMTKIRQGDVSHKETVAWIKKEQKLLKKSAMSERK